MGGVVRPLRGLLAVRVRVLGARFELFWGVRDLVFGARDQFLGRRRLFWGGFKAAGQFFGARFELL